MSWELTIADGIVNVRLELIETDLTFDEHNTVSQIFGAAQNSERIKQRTFGDCEVFAQWDRDVQLIVPLPSQGPTLEQVAQG